MGKVVRNITIIVMGFTIASLFLYRLRLGYTPGSRLPQSSSSTLMETEGQVSEVDEGDGRLVLSDGDKTIVVIFDEGTSIIDSGEIVKASAIAPGTRARIRYQRRAGKNWARVIALSTRTSY